jgi:uncharacterized membrane protein (UPF0127 family)
MIVEINKIQFPAQFLKNQEDIRNGMMNRENLDGCMVFDVGKGHHSFWMKDCLIPLDIIYVHKNKISKIHLNCEPQKNVADENIKRYTGYGDFVIEFPANTAKKWNVGDNVKFLN